MDSELQVLQPRLACRGEEYTEGSLSLLLLVNTSLGLPRVCSARFWREKESSGTLKKNEARFGVKLKSKHTQMHKQVLN